MSLTANQTTVINYTGAVVNAINGLISASSAARQGLGALNGAQAIIDELVALEASLAPHAQVVGDFLAAESAMSQVG